MPFLTTGTSTSIQLLLAHGAGGAMDHPWMNRMAELIAGHDIEVVRFEFPYMAARREGARKAPDREPVLRKTWLDAIAARRDGRRIFIGGKSMGGRIASMIADEAGVDGLICLGYPFHPPGQPEKLRTAHLAGLSTRSLIVQGTRDPFGTREEVATYSLSPAISLHWVEDGDHNLTPRKSVTGRSAGEEMARVAEVVAGFSRA